MESPQTAAGTRLVALPDDQPDESETDKSIYCGFSEVAKIQYIKVLACIRTTYKVIDFVIGLNKYFFATYHCS